MSELSPTALVVRGGSNRDVQSLMRLILEAVEDGDGPVLSVFCESPASGETFDHALRRLCDTAGIPHPKVLVARAGDVTAAGVTLVSDTDDGQPSNHYHAVFHLPMEESQLQRFVACFDGPVPNPTGGKRGRSR